MELLVVIHHPGVAIRPVEAIAAELASVYDRAMSAPSQRHTWSAAHATVILLVWPARRLGWVNWHQDERGTLAVAGLPLLHCPHEDTTGEHSAMIAPGRLASMMVSSPRELGECGGYFAAAHVAKDGTVRLATNYLGEVPLYRAAAQEPSPLGRGQGEGSALRGLVESSDVNSQRALTPTHSHPRNGERGSDTSGARMPAVTVWSNKAAAAAMLAGLKPALDPRGATEFILLSHTLDERTLWSGVALEPPGVCIELSPEQPGASGKQAATKRTPYIDLPSAYFAHRQPMDITARRFTASMRPLVEALRDSATKHPGVDESRLHLSGGQDSRCVAALMLAHGFQPLCVTHNTPNDEVEAARLLARELGMRHRLVPSGDAATMATFEQLAEASLWQSDGAMSLKYLCGVYDLELIRREQYIPIEGLGGEYGRAYYFENDAMEANVAKGDFSPVLAKAIGGRRELWPRPDEADAIRDRITQYLAQQTAAGLDPYQATTFYYVNQKMRHWATARRNTGWQWVIDPLQMPSWTYAGMSASPHDQREDRLIRAVVNAAWPGVNEIPTVPDLAYAARRRRVASNRIVRTALKWYDKMKAPMPAHVQTRTLRDLRDSLAGQIGSAGEAMTSLIAPDTARGFLAREPWSYVQTEMFWHCVTLAYWCKTFANRKPPIAPCWITARG